MTIVKLCNFINSQLQESFIHSDLANYLDIWFKYSKLINKNSEEQELIYSQFKCFGSLSLKLFHKQLNYLRIHLKKKQQRKKNNREISPSVLSLLFLGGPAPSSSMVILVLTKHFYNKFIQ